MSGCRAPEKNGPGTCRLTLPPSPFRHSPARARSAGVAAQLQTVLATRTFLAGYSFTLADAAAFAALRAGDAGAAGASNEVQRWRALCEATLPVAKADALLKGTAAAPGAAAPGTAAAPAPRGAVAPSAEGEAKKAAALAAIAAKKAAAAAAAAAAGGAGAGAGAAASSAGSSAPSSRNVGGGGDTGSMPALEGAVEGQVVTRFPPEPSGYLHIGHVKAVLLNDFYARSYKGRLVIRFDDTNPSKEKDEFEQNIIQDLAALGVKGDFVSHTSDYFDLLADYARQMIRDGKAFMDDTPQEQMREERSERKDSARRGASVETNLALFEAMLLGGEEGGKWCMRAKINMQDNNGTLRDPVMFRVNETPHHRTGSRYKAYPTYDFACPIVDSIEGVTHALRTNEYHDRDAQYAWIQAALGVRKVIIHEFARLNFIYTLLSKRKLTWFVENRFVEGWYDPRFPTVQGILRRGCTLPALREFILSQGASNRDTDMEWDKFWATNKKHIDPTAHRYTAIAGEGRVLVSLSGPGCPAEPEVRPAPLHPKNAEAGTKAVYFGPRVWFEAEDAKSVKEGEEVTLMKWGNAIIRKVRADGWRKRGRREVRPNLGSSLSPSLCPLNPPCPPPNFFTPLPRPPSPLPSSPQINRSADGSSITGIDAELHLEGDFKKTEKKLTWIADLPGLAPGERSVPAVLQDFDYLITVPKLEEGDDFMAAVNKLTKVESTALCEPAARALKANDIIQLERKGFYRVDRPYLGEDRPLLLFAIPDGRVRTWGVGSAPAGGADKAAAADKGDKKKKGGK